VTSVNKATTARSARIHSSILAQLEVMEPPELVRAMSVNAYHVHQATIVQRPLLAQLQLPPDTGHHLLMYHHLKPHTNAHLSSIVQILA